MTWTDWIQPVLAGGAALAAIIGIGFGLLQLRLSRIAAEAESLSTLWQCFDAEEYRALRRKIHGAIPNEEEHRPAAGQLSPEILEAIQTTATAMDRIGFMLVTGHLSDEAVFARYMEVVIPLWEKSAPHLLPIRQIKHGGWMFFGPYPPDIARPALVSRFAWLSIKLSRKPDNLYERARLYRKRAYELAGAPEPDFGTFSPTGTDAET